MKFLEIVLTVLVVAKFVGTLKLGDRCTVVKTGQLGWCRHLSKCPVVLEAAYQNIAPQTCGMAGTVAIVCCPRRVKVKVLEGNHCKLNNTTPGVCTTITNCPKAIKAAVRGILPQKCDLTDNASELVCCTEPACPPLPKGFVTQVRVGSKAADYCIKLAEKIHPCQETGSGWTRGDICPPLTPHSNTYYYHTHIKTAAEAPYYGEIGSDEGGDITWQGYPVSLVSEQWVLCSAWAIKTIGPSNVQFVGLGGRFTPQYNPDETFEVISRHIHPLYDYKSEYHSIALLKLDRLVTFTARILPVCLHTGTALPDSGFIRTGNPGQKHLAAQLSMQRLPQEECSKVFNNDDPLPAGIIQDQQICNRPPNTDEECLGWYSSSPLTLRNSHRVACTHLLVGLRVYYNIEPCIDVSIRISYYIPWIEGIVWP